MKKILLLLALIGFSYCSFAQESSKKLFEICYYPKYDLLEMDATVIKCYAIIPIYDDSAKTMKDWFSREDIIKLGKNSSSIILKYCPDKYELPTKEYKIK